MSINDQCESDSQKMFVGQIPRTMAEGELKEFMSKYGEIFELILLKDRITSQSRGCCFITYAKRQSALKAQEELHNKHIFPGMKHSVQMKVSDSEMKSDERKLFVGMIPKQFTDFDLRELFSSYGDIEESVVLTDSDGNSKGCGFVTFAAKKSAICAIHSLHQTKRFDGCSGPIVVKVADNSRQREQRKNLCTSEYLPQSDINLLNQHYFMQRYPLYSSYGFYGRSRPQLRSNSITVHNLPCEYGDGDLSAIFSCFGKVILAKVMIGKEGNSRCVGSVCYQCHSAADAAVQRMNGFQIGERRIKVQLKKSKNTPY